MLIWDAAQIHFEMLYCSLLAIQGKNKLQLHVEIDIVDKHYVNTTLVNANPRTNKNVVAL